MSKAGMQKGEFVRWGGGELPRGSFTRGHAGLDVKFVVCGRRGKWRSLRSGCGFKSNYLPLPA